MREFLNNSNLIFKDLKELEHIVKNMKEFVLLKQTSVLDDSKEAALEEKIARLDFKFEKISDLIKNEIESNKKDTDSLEKKNGYSSEIQVRRAHILKHSSNLTNIIGDYRNLKLEYKNKERDLLRRAFQIADPSIEDSKIDEMIDDSKDESDNSKPFSVVSKASKHTKNRKNRIDKIVITIQRLAKMIDEINSIVHDDSKYVDDILSNVTEAEMNTMKAKKELSKALESQRKVNFYKKVFLFIIVLFVVLIIIWVQNRFFGPNRTNN